MHWKKELEEKGYAKIEGVFTKAETDIIRREAIMALPLAMPKGCVQVRSGYPALLFGPSNFSTTLGSFIRDRRLKDIVFSVLGENVFHLVEQIYFRMGGDGDSFALHQDISFRTPPDDFHEIENGYLQTIICVDGMDEENGAIEFEPGSHKKGDLGLVPRDNSEYGLRGFDRRGWQGEKVRANPGDVLVWSPLVVHGSEPNNSSRWRMNYMSGFAAEAAVKSKNRFPKYV